MGKNHKKNPINILQILLSILLIIFIVLLVISLMKIIKWYKDNNNNNKIIEEISKTVTINEEQSNVEDKYDIDFAKLKEKNSDTIGWIKVNGTNVENTVVKATNNDYYLNHNFEKKYNEAGWIFVDYKNRLDGTDKNIILYGHNRRDNSMFGSLKNILNKEWYDNKENLEIYFITENEKCIYEVFSIYKIENEEYYIKTDFESDNEFSKFLEVIKGRSQKDFNVDVTSEDSILTLSTCANDNDYRIVLHAKKIK